jgi:hypothetical protein
VLAALLGASVVSLRAQELEPRSYSPAPIGTNFVLLGGVYQSGDVLPDPSIPVTDVTAEASSVVLAYSRSFGLWGHSASIALAVPYVWLHASGNVGGSERERSVTGPGDPKLRFVFGLIGSPALTPEEFARRTPQPLLGASLTVSAPFGDYDASKLVNIGTNRWAVKPELGLSLPLGNVFAEAAAGVWLFTDNQDFFGGQVRQQDPMYSLQLHAGYNFRPGFWVAADGTFFTGGQTSVDGVEKDDQQSNSRYGLTLAYPLTRQFSLKASWSRGLITRVGGDFDTLALFLQYRWFDGERGR